MWKCVSSTSSRVRPARSARSVIRRRGPVPASTTTAPSEPSGSSRTDEVSRRPVGTKPPLPRMVAAASMGGWSALLRRGGRLDDRDGRAGLDRLALLDRERLDHARLVRGDLVLHLHGLDDADELTL